MELKLRGYGTIEITNATLVDGGDILIETADNFSGFAKTTDYDITDAYLTETEYGWGFVALLNIPLTDWFAEDAIILDIENQDDIYKLNAFL